LCSRSLLITGEILLVDGRLAIRRNDGCQRAPQSGDHGSRRGDPVGERRPDELGQLINGRSAAGPITAFDPREFMVRFACEARDFDATRWIDLRRARRMGRFAQLVVAAARQAEADAGLLVERESDRVGASVATAMGGLQAFEDCCATLRERGPNRVNPFSIPTIIPNMGARPGSRSSSEHVARSAPSAPPVRPRRWRSARVWTRFG
jgi:Beta-ketoacyl synthase, N-terminal domain